MSKNTFKKDIPVYVKPYKISESQIKVVPVDTSVAAVLSNSNPVSQVVYGEDLPDYNYKSLMEIRQQMKQNSDVISTTKQDVENLIAYKAKLDQMDSLKSTINEENQL